MRLLAAWELGLGYGHVATLAPVCRALRGHGHRLTLAARTPATARLLEHDSFDAIVRSPRYTGRVPAGETLTYGQVIAAGGLVDTAQTIALIGQWLRLFERIGPDALIAEHAPMSLLAAHVAGLPAVRLGSGFVAPSARSAGASLLPWAAHSEAALAAAQRPADRIVREVCRHYGVPLLGGLSELLMQAPLHSLAWAELDHYGPGASGFYYGPLVGIAADARPEWPKGDGPRALVYLPFDRPGSLVVARALAALRWPVLWHSASAPAIELPATIRYSPEPIDLGTTGREAAIYVGRGGYGGSAAMLGTGVPQLLLPDTLESLLLTYRLSLAGVAHSQAASAGVQAVGEALCRVARSDAIRERAAAVAGRYADYSVAAMTDLVTQDMTIAMRG
ncbi:hypothetical protein HZY97_14495 [Sphingomonas sp. R-74633]|uniref:hypothetical protein n=1 Tax=Sphingomonas sp. R-74633 TaxID=2751188 RepID=UPI0015D1FA31|nr:hypothetical protein [Sphingomonas sp. R-74633]NYT41976.1 hypothetical protein [Sphingomonas sp. R-74633]